MNLSMTWAAVSYNEIKAPPITQDSMSCAAFGVAEMKRDDM